MKVCIQFDRCRKKELRKIKASNYDNKTRKKFMNRSSFEIIKSGLYIFFSNYDSDEYFGYKLVKVKVRYKIVFLFYNRNFSVTVRLLDFFE